MKDIDISQLIVFLEVYDELNITRASENLEISQSAASKEINKLRNKLGDQLFIRRSRGVIPTYKAKELYPKIKNIVDEIYSVFPDGRDDFNPANTKMHFTIATTEYISFTIVPRLIKRIKKIAPFAKIVVKDMGDIPPEDYLYKGDVDLVLSSTVPLNYPLYKAPLFKDYYVCLVSKNNKYVEEGIDINDFCNNLNHISVPGPNGSQHRVFANTMQELNLTRNVIVQVPHFLSIPALLIDSDLVVTIANKLALYFKKEYDLEIVPHPIPLKEFEIYQIWHQRTNNNRSLMWLRSQILEEARGL